MTEMARALGKAVDEKTLQADLERYRQMALDLGASAAVIIPASDVNIDERVWLKCFVPRCPHAGQTPNCPPYAPDLEIVRRALSRFSWAILFKCPVPLTEDGSKKKTGEVTDELKLSFHLKSAEVAYELERQAFRDGYHLAMGFGGGSCKDYLCKGKPCQFMESRVCRFPLRARPAMEAVGMDVFSLMVQVGWVAHAVSDKPTSSDEVSTVGIVFVC